MVLLRILFLSGVILLNIHLPISAQWVDKSNKELMNSDAVSSIDQCRNTIIWAGWHMGINISPDSGQTWLARDIPGFPTARDMAANYNNIYVATDAGVYTSENLGNTWRLIDALGRSPFSVVEDNDDMLVAGGRGLWLSHDDGKLWAKQFSDTAIYSICLSVQSSYVMTAHGLYRSNNRCDTWSLVNDTIQNQLINPVSNKLLVWNGTLLATAKGNGVWVSYDGGSRWQKVTNGLPNVQVTSFETVNNDFYAGIYGGGVYVSRNKGQEWFPANKGLEGIKNKEGHDVPNITIYSLYHNYLFLFAGTYKGVGLYRRSLQELRGIHYIGDGLLVAPYLANADVKWYCNDTLIPNAKSYKYTATKNATYSVSILLEDLYSKRVAGPILMYHKYTVNDLAVTSALNTALENDYKIFPNPSTGFVNLKLDRANISHITITDLSSNVLREIPSPGTTNELRIDLSHEPKGMYILKIHTSDKIIIRKIVLQ